MPWRITWRTAGNRHNDRSSPTCKTLQIELAGCAALANNVPNEAKQTKQTEGRTMKNVQIENAKDKAAMVTFALVSTVVCLFIFL